MPPRLETSIRALLRRAGDLGTITPRVKQYLWTQMGMRGFRKHEPIDIPTEEPTLLRELLEVHQTKLGHDLPQLAKIMRVRESELMTEYIHPTGLGAGTIGGTRLRVV